MGQKYCFFLARHAGAVLDLIRTWANLFDLIEYCFFLLAGHDALVLLGAPLLGVGVVAWLFTASLWTAALLLLVLANLLLNLLGAMYLAGADNCFFDFEFELWMFQLWAGGAYRRPTCSVPCTWRVRLEAIRSSGRL